MYSSERPKTSAFARKLWRTGGRAYVPEFLGIGGFWTTSQNVTNPAQIQLLAGKFLANLHSMLGCRKATLGLAIALIATSRLSMAQGFILQNEGATVQGSLTVGGSVASSSGLTEAAAIIFAPGSSTEWFGAVGEINYSAMAGFTASQLASIQLNGFEAVNTFDSGTELSSLSQVPEPSSIGLIASGTVAFGLIAKSRRCRVRFRMSSI